MKRLVALILFFGLSILAVINDSARAESLADALINLKNGKKSMAHQKLERLFEQSQDVQEKAAAALLNASANPKYIKISRRVYAEYALAHSKVLTPADRHRLLRISADELFASAQVDSAARAYEAALKVPGVSEEDSEYVTYKLGWVYLNQKRPEASWKLWTDWVSRHSSGGLRSSILKDSGKVYVEGLYGKSTHLNVAALKITTPEDVGAFQEGLIIGLGRIQNPSLDQLRTSLKGSSFFTPLVSHLIAAGGFFAKDPCTALSWIRESNLTGLSSERVQTYLSACAGLQPKRGGKDWTIIAQIYGDLSLKGEGRQARAEAFSAAHRSPEACSEYERGLTEILQSDAARSEAVPAWVITTHHRCHGGLSNELIAMLVSNASVQSNSVKGPSTKAWLSAWTELARDKQTQGRLEVAILGQVSAWKSTRVPELLVDELPLKEKAKVISAFGGSEPLSDHFRSAFELVVKDLIHAAEWQQARALLDRHAPLSDQMPAKDFKFWNQLALQKKLSSSDLDRLTAVSAKRGSELSETDREGLLAIWIEQKKWDQIFSHYDVVKGEIQQNPELAGQLASEYFERLMSGNAPSIETRDELGRYLSEMKTVMTVANTSSTVLRLEAPRFLRKSQLHQDLSRFVLLKNLENEYSKVKLTAGPKLAKELGNRVVKLRSSVQRATQTAWGSELILTRADEVVARMSGSFADKIAKIPVESDADRTELLALSETVRQWRLK